MTDSDEITSVSMGYAEFRLGTKICIPNEEVKEYLLHQYRLQAMLEQINRTLKEQLVKQLQEQSKND